MSQASGNIDIADTVIDVNDATLADKTANGFVIADATPHELWLALERATRLQIELAADDAAARQVGAAHLANALIVLAAATHDVGMTLRAERLTRKRWPTPQRRRIPQGLHAAAQLR